MSTRSWRYRPRLERLAAPLGQFMNGGMHFTPVAPIGCASRLPRPAGDQFGRYGIEYHRLLDEAIEQFAP